MTLTCSDSIKQGQHPDRLPLLGWDRWVNLRRVLGSQHNRPGECPGVSNRPARGAGLPANCERLGFPDLHSPLATQAPLPGARAPDQPKRSRSGGVCPLALAGGGGGEERHPRPSTHEFLVVVIGEEHLEPRGPVFSPPQQPVGALVSAHVAVPGVFLNGCLRSSRPHQEIHTFNAKAPGRKPSGAEGTLTPRPVPDGGWPRCRAEREGRCARGRGLTCSNCCSRT